MTLMVCRLIDLDVATDCVFRGDDGFLDLSVVDVVY